MPRTVRNFWITVEVDGKALDVSCGPAKKDGGFSLRVRQRDEGEIITACDICGQVGSDGETLTLYVQPKDGTEQKVVTKR